MTPNKKCGCFDTFYMILKEFDLKWNKYIVLISITITMVASVGSDCSSNPCMYGICVDDPDSSYRCYCIDGYTGINCEINWDDCWSNPCLNGGTCNDAIASYNCTCLEGFVGLNCEQKYSECMNDPCLNNGTCLDHNGFTCQCLEGFSGDFCEIDIAVCNDTICKNFGECVEGSGLSFACRCLEGWTGKFCEEDLNECLASPCQNGGLCINEPGTYTCACLFGFTGKECEREIVPCEENPCRNNAVCLLEDAQPVCYCVPDYHGSFCELRYDDCESKNARCANGGTCVDGVNNFTCSCPPPYAGDMCNVLLETPTWSTELYFPDTTFPSAYTDRQQFTRLSSYSSAPASSSSSSSSSSPSSSYYTSETVSTLLEVSVTPEYTEYEESTIVKTTSEAVTSEATETDETVETTQPESVTTTDSSGYFTTRPVEAYTSYEASESSEPSSFSTLTQDYTTSMIPETSSSFSPGQETEPVNDTSTLGYVTSREPLERSYPFEEDYSTEGRLLTTMPTLEIESTYSQTGSTIQMFTSEGSTEARTGSSEDGLQVPTSVSALDTDYDETATNTSGQGNITFAYGPYTTETSSSPVTMLPSSLPTPIGVNTSFTRPTSTSVGTQSVTGVDSELTTLTEFFETSLAVTDAGEKASGPTITGHPTEPGIHSCTRDQCVNVSLCLYNATQCDCSYRNNCKRPSSIKNAAFSGNSYVRQKFMVENGLLIICVRLKTKAKSGILIHTLFDDERYVLLYVESGQLKFQFSCGLQTMLFGELDSPINNGFEVDVEIRFHYTVEEASDKCLARLLVNDSVVMSGEQVLQTHGSMPEYARLHLGGIPVAFSHQFPHIVLGFVGCMSLFKINGVKRDFIHDSIEAVQIEECNSFLCLSNPCKNFGACQEIYGKITCKCIAGYSGKTCEKSVCDDNPCHLGATCIISPGANFICICPLGTHGLFCERDTTIMQPSFLVFSPGLSSYMAYGISASLKDNMELKLRIIPQTLDQISLIAYMGQSGLKHDSSDHFSITYVRGYFMLTWDLGSGVRRIFTSSPLNTKQHKVHTLKIGRRGRDSWLFVEGIGNVTGRAAGTNTRLDVSPILYIGGHKSRYFETLPHDLPLHTGFSGCIYDIELRTDDNVFPLTMTSPATGRGVGECHRNECSHHSCKNGAVCLNYGPTYSCICMKDWEGPDCSNPVNCTLSDQLCLKNNK